MNTVCISTKNDYPEKMGGGTKHRASLPLQKVGGHVPCPPTDLRPCNTNLCTFSYRYIELQHAVRVQAFTDMEAKVAQQTYTQTCRLHTTQLAEHHLKVS